ncbi:MAG: DMT family transporter [Minisyncoccia bacterium]
MDPILFFALLMLVGTLFLSFNQIQSKQLLTAGVDEQAILSILFLGGAIIFWPILLFVGFPAVEARFWPALAGTMILNVIAQNLFYRAYKMTEVSRIAPLRLLTPILVIGTGFILLHETPTIQSIVGIFISAFGFYILLFSGWRVHMLDRGTWYGLAGSALFALSFPLDKTIVISSSTLFAVTLNTTGIGIITFALNTLSRHGFMRDTLRIFARRPIALARVAALGAAGHFFVNHSLSYAPVSVASNFKRVEALWTILLAGTLLKEKDILRKLVAVSLILTGILLSLLWR